MENKHELPRAFGVTTGWFVVIASMVGSGILTNSGPILKATQHPFLTFGLWGIGGVLALLGALTLAEMASGIPKAGGDYVYVYTAFGPRIAFVYGWAMFMLGFAAPVALVSSATATSLYQVFGIASASQWLLVNSIATVLIILFCFFHSRGHTSSASVQSATTLFYVFALAGFILTAILSGNPQVNYLQQGVSWNEVSIGSLGSGLILVMYAYSGWNAGSYLAGEIRNPKKNLPWCLFLGCASVTVLYLCLNFGYFILVSTEQVRNFSDFEVGHIAETAVKVALGDKVARVFSAFVAVGMLATLSAFILAGSRIVYAMTRDGLFPKQAGRLHPKYNVPAAAIFLQCFFALIFLWSGTFEQILNFTGYGLAVLGTLIVAPIFVLRRNPEFRPTFRIMLYPLPPILFLIMNTASLVTGAIDAPILSLLSVLTISLGFVFYEVWIRRG